MVSQTEPSYGVYYTIRTYLGPIGYSPHVITALVCGCKHTFVHRGCSWFCDLAGVLIHTHAYGHEELCVVVEVGTCYLEDFVLLYCTKY